MPKFGMTKDRFNTNKELAWLNIGKLAYHIEKGDLDASKPITMRDLFESGTIPKI